VDWNDMAWNKFQGQAFC